MGARIRSVMSQVFSRYPRNYPYFPFPFCTIFDEIFRSTNQDSFLALYGFCLFFHKTPPPGIPFFGYRFCFFTFLTFLVGEDARYQVPFFLSFPTKPSHKGPDPIPLFSFRLTVLLLPPHGMVRKMFKRELRIDQASPLFLLSCADFPLSHHF